MMAAVTGPLRRRQPADGVHKRWAVALLWAAGAAGIAVAGVVSRWQLVHGHRWGITALTGIWALTWIVAGWAASRCGRRAALLAVVVLGVAMRILAVSGSFSISDDAYRYAWDGRVQVSGTDPYRYPPAAGALRGLHDRWLWPDPATCRSLAKKPGCTRINRPTDRTIYPPVAEGWFTAVNTVAGAGHARTWQAAGALVDIGVLALLVYGLALQGRDTRLAAWYAFCPLPVLEFVNNAHVDGLALLFMLSAFLALAKRRRGLAGALIGAATMVKLYPAVALLAMWREGRRRMVIAWLAVVVLTEAPHVAVVGTKVIGFLPGYLQQEGYDSGHRFLLFGLPGLSAAGQQALAALVLATVWWLVVRRPRPPVAATAGLLGSLLLITASVQPWYAVTVAGLGVMAAAPWWAVIALAAEPYYVAVITHLPHFVAIGRLGYGLAAAVIVVMTRRRRPSIGARSPRPSPVPDGGERRHAVPAPLIGSGRGWNR